MSGARFSGRGESTAMSHLASTGVKSFFNVAGTVDPKSAEGRVYKNYFQAGTLVLSGSRLETGNLLVGGTSQ